MKIAYRLLYNEDHRALGTYHVDITNNFFLYDMQ